jgi:hypothetical protein
MKNKGWRFSANEKKYLHEVLENGFSASEDGSMNERFENKLKFLFCWLDLHRPNCSRKFTI